MLTIQQINNKISVSHDAITIQMADGILYYTTATILEKWNQEDDNEWQDATNKNRWTKTKWMSKDIQFEDGIEYFVNAYVTHSKKLLGLVVADYSDDRDRTLHIWIQPDGTYKTVEING